MPLPLVLIMIILGAYSIMILGFFYGLSRKHAVVQHQQKGSGKLDVLIPFRNEKETLALLLDDLLSQNYPREYFRVLLINDHSDDGSEEIAASYGKSYDHFIFLNQDLGKSGKKAALDMGIRASDACWILQIDADCRLDPSFLSSRMDYAYQTQEDLVAGPVKTEPRAASLRENFEALDLLSLMAVAAGSAGLGRPLMCSGANLLYRRELYAETRQFDPEERIASGDDMFLLIGARKLGKRFGYQSGAEVTVRTGASVSWRSLLTQRIRWGGKSTSYGMPDIQATALLVVLASLAWILAAVVVLINPGMRLWSAVIMGLKLIADFLLMLKMANRSAQLKTLRFYFPVAILHPFFMLVAALASMIVRPSWK